MKRQFIDKIFEYSSLSGLYYNLHFEAGKAFYWEFCDTLYYDGLTKDRFFRRYRALGATGNYMHAYFAHLFLRDNAAKNGAGRDADSHLYL